MCASVTLQAAPKTAVLSEGSVLIENALYRRLARWMSEDFRVEML